MGTIKEIFRAIAEALGLIRQRDAAKNAENIQAAARARQEQAKVEEAIKATSEKDVDKTREQLSEN